MSFTFKGVSSDTYLKELKVGHSVLPSSNISLVDVAGRSGAYFVKKQHGVREIEIDVAIIGADQADLKTKTRNIADWLDSDKPEALVFSDEPDKTYYGILDGETKLSQILAIGTGTLKFICPDPFAYGTERVVTAGTTTVEWTNFVVGYAGTAEVYPKITATFNHATTYFEIWSGEEFVRITASFQAGDVLVIDSNTGVITINGTLNIQTMSLDSDFFSLKKGNNTLSSSEYADVEVRYKERFK